MNKLLSYVLLAIISISNGIIFSQIELPEDKVKTTISLNQDDCSLEVVVDVDIVEGWHINSHWLPEGSFSIPTNINIEKSINYKIQAGVIEPAPILEFDEMADETSFRGYGPEQGYHFLREAITDHDFKKRNAAITADEIFISDGAKCDSGNFQELFSDKIVIAIPDPVYPVYLDTNVMAGRTGTYKDGRYQGVVYLESTRENKSNRVRVSA